jgi:hypothetical protein
MPVLPKSKNKLLNWELFATAREKHALEITSGGFVVLIFDSGSQVLHLLPEGAHGRDNDAHSIAIHCENELRIDSHGAELLTRGLKAAT